MSGLSRMFTCTFGAAALSIAPAFAQDPFPDYGKRFSQYSGNPLLALESTNPWNLPWPGEPYVALPGAVHPDVLYFPNGMSGYKFWMVFTPYDGWADTEAPPAPWLSLAHYWERPTLLRSHDGWNWEKTGITTNPLIHPKTDCNAAGVCPGGRTQCTWDQGVFYDPDLVYAGPERGWFLYFAVARPCATYYNLGPKTHIALARSADGLNYVPYGRVMPNGLGVTASDFLATPSIVFDEATGSFKAWYLHGNPWDPTVSFGYATSTDGLQWTPAWTPECPTSSPCWRNAVVERDPAPGSCDQGGISHPDVIKKDNEFWMYYQASPRSDFLYHDLLIRRATSVDGTNWIKDSMPILSKYQDCPTTNQVPGTWTFWQRTAPWNQPKTVTMFYRPSAVMVGNAMYLYFGGLNKPCYDPATCKPFDFDIGVAFSTRFADVPPTHWAYPAIEAVAQAGITAGCGGNNFCPDQVATRKEAAAFVRGGAQIPPSQQPWNHYFCDLLPDGYAADVNAVYENGMADSCGSCTPPDTRLRFCPDEQMDRLKLGLFFYKALGLQGDGTPYFTDVAPPDKGKIDRLHDPDVDVAAGCAPSLYCPTDMATRATLAAFTEAAYLSTIRREDDVER